MRPEIAATLHANARERFARCWRDGLQRRKKRLPSVWATEVRKMPPGGPVSGTRVVPYDHDYMPHCVEQMDAADDPSVNIIAIVGDRRSGKTGGVCLNIIGRTITDDPGGIYSVQPNDDDVAKFSAEDAEPMIELCLQGYFVEKKSRDAGRTKSFKKYRGGFWRIPSALSPTKFRGTTVKVVCIHEADKLARESVHMAIGRAEGIEDAIIILETTPTIAASIGEDGKKQYNAISEEFFDMGDQRKWFTECQSCGAWQIIVYEDFRWPEGRMAETKWHCQRCDHGHTEPLWRKAAQKSRWFPTAGLTAEQLLDIRANAKHARAIRPEIRSYWKNGFTSLLKKQKGFATKLHEFVAKGEAAKASPESLKIWTQEVAAKYWSADPAETTPPPWKPMYDRRESYGLTVPERGLFITSFTDVHDNRLEVLWQAWGRNEESWVMDHVVLQGSVFQPAVWQLWRRELGREFAHALGCTIKLGFGLIDGGDNAEAVYRTLQDLSRNPEPGVSGLIRASKGVGAHPHPVIGPYGPVARNLKGHSIGTWQAKKLLYTERFRMSPREEVCDGRKRTAEDPMWDLWDADEKRWIPDYRSGVMHFRRISENDQELFEQMVRERPKIEILKGDEVMKFENPKKLRNEGLDLLVGNLAAVRLYSRPWDLLEADLRQRAEAAKQGAQPVQRPSLARRRSSYVSDWR